MNFKDLGLSENIVNTLSKKNITVPTDAQIKAIKPILNGEDVIIKSQTGSGKTFAYLLPFFEKGDIEKGNKIVIIVPTRELCMQVHSVVQDFSKESNIELKSAVLFGGVNIKLQTEKLKEKPQIIIGTMDRVLELIKKKKVSAHLIKTFIVDEADKLVDKNSLDGLKALRKTFMRDIQTIFVSATFHEKSINAIKEIAPQIKLLESEVKEEVPQNIKHYFIRCDMRDKLENLRKLIGVMKPQKALIFINELSEINTAVAKLNYHKLGCKSIHSETAKTSRQEALREFNKGKLKYLVSTDLSARGLDVSDIEVVYNMSIAQNPSDYLHRAGRTGRSGKDGVSVSIVGPSEMQYLKKYIAKYDIEITEIKMRNGEITILDKNDEVCKIY